MQGDVPVDTQTRQAFLEVTGKAPWWRPRQVRCTRWLIETQSAAGRW